MDAMNAPPDEFHQLWSRLKPDLTELEALRRTIIQSLSWWACAFVLVSGLFVGAGEYFSNPRSYRIVRIENSDFQMPVYSPLHLDDSQLLYVFLLIVMLSLIGLWQFWKRRVRPFRLMFKNRIVTAVIRAIDPSLTYQPDGGIPQAVMMGTGLFQTSPNVYVTDDLVEGKVGATTLRFAEIHASRVQSNGKQTIVIPVFNGLYFIADFNKHFRSKVLVRPDTAERLLGSMGRILQSPLFGRAKLQRLEDAEFEKEFAVVAEDPQESRYILTPSLMERIMEFRRSSGHRLALAFAGSEVHVAVGSNRKLFEPNLFTRTDSPELVSNYVRDVRLALGLVEDLNLNTRIWSKE